MKATDKRTCPVCKTLLDGDSDVCPICALKSALESENHATVTELRFEHYQILKNGDQSPMELGHGSMGVTYKALDVQLQRPVALKIINAKFIGDASARQRFVREARAAASVRHQNVASVYHLGEIGGDYFYAMEFVEGETLANVIQHGGRLSADLALEIAAQVAAGLDAIHEQHLVHRDIKPSNIMVSLKEGQLQSVKIIDLGLAKAVSEEGSISAPGSFVGTPGYASPEQFAGVGVDIRSDLYSLGITLWEMLSGSLPFHGTNSELLSQHLHAPLPVDRLARARQQILPLLEILLEKDPGRRFQTPSELLKALAIVTDAIDSGRQLTKAELCSSVAKRTSAARSGLLRRDSPSRASKRWRFLGWLAALLVAAALLVGQFLFFRPQQPSSSGPSSEGPLGEKGVAVLPFENLSTDPGSGSFADGVQDDILTNLAKIADLKVIGRTSVMRYRDVEKRDLREIANNLGVENLLEGTVRREANRVRISARLMHANNAQTLWADSFDKELTDVFSIQSEIAQIIANRLRARLSPKEKSAITEAPTHDLAAYELYLQAKGHDSLFEIGDPNESYIKRIGLLKEAIGRDPNFAQAYALLSQLYVWQMQEIGGNLGSTTERLALAQAALNEAVRLRPDLAETRLAKAVYLLNAEQNPEKARLEAAAVVEESPNNIEALETLAGIEIARDHWDEGLNLYERAATLDPQNLGLLQSWALYCQLARRYRESKRVWEKVHRLAPDDQNEKLVRTDSLWGERGDIDLVRECLATTLYSDVSSDFAGWRFNLAVTARDWQTAEQTLQAFGREWFPVGIFLNTFVPREFCEGLISQFKGDTRKATAAFTTTVTRLLQKIPDQPDDPRLHSYLGLTYALLGRKEDALTEAKRTVDRLKGTKTSNMSTAVGWSNVICVYAWIGEQDKAIDGLLDWAGKPLSVEYGELKYSPMWDPLRNNPRFQELLVRLAPKGSSDEASNITAPPEKSVAVLPFESLSENKADSYFADGVQDEILNNLAKIAQLKVISRTSVMQYRGNAKRDLRQIANALGVANILEGTVRRDGNRVRVSTELIDAGKDRTIWADSYDRDLTDIFTIQSDVAKAIAAKLAATLSPAEKKSVEARPTDNLEAYDLYLRGKESLFNAAGSSGDAYVKEQLLQAVDFFSKAVRLDPNFVPAYCACAEANDLLYTMGSDPTPERLARADAAISAALRLRPDLPEVHLAEAQHLSYGYLDNDGARVQLAIAKSGLPNSVEVTNLEALIDRQQGNWQKAIQGFKESLTRDPRNLRALNQLALTLGLTRKFDAAEPLYDRMIDSRPDLPMHKVDKAFWTRYYKGADTNAVWSAIAALPQSADADADALGIRLWFSLIDHDWTQAEQIIANVKGRDIESPCYGLHLLPVEYYAVLMARLRKDQPVTSALFAGTREQLSLRVSQAPQAAGLLSQLAVLDAWLNNKETAISEAKRATEILPVSRSAVVGPQVLKNLAVVYSWSGEFDQAFAVLEPLTELPAGIFYGELKRDPWWEPLRQDPRYNKLLDKLAPKD